VVAGNLRRGAQLPHDAPDLFHDRFQAIEHILVLEPEYTDADRLNVHLPNWVAAIRRFVAVAIAVHLDRQSQRGTVEIHDVRADTVLAPLPMFHINPLGYGVVGALTAQSGLLAMPRFSARQFWPTVLASGATVLMLHAPPVEILKRATTSADAAGHRVRAVFYADEEFLVRFGVPLGLSRMGHRAAMPHIEYWRAIPPPALLPISIVLLHSIGNLQKVSFIAFFCIFPVLLNTIDGIRGIDPTLLDTARSYGVPQHERIRRIVLPAAFPQIVAGMRNSLALAVIMMVLTEYFSSTSGVGYVLLISKNTFQLVPMWAAIVLIGVLGYLLNVLFLLVERRVLAWHRGWRAALPD